jgi:hypothetical protein
MKGVADFMKNIDKLQKFLGIELFDVSGLTNYTEQQKVVQKEFKSIGETVDSLSGKLKSLFVAAPKTGGKTGGIVSEDIIEPTTTTTGGGGGSVAKQPKNETLSPTNLLPTIGKLPEQLRSVTAETQRAKEETDAFTVAQTAAGNAIQYTDEKIKLLQDSFAALNAGIKNIIDHIKFCSLKIDEIKKIKIDSNLKKECIYFLNKKIIPKFNQLNKNFLKRNFLNKKKNKLLRNQMVVSPSDFGLHNIIKSNKNFFFLDFEYAGLDDPIKLICDFFSQPDQSLSSSQKELFIKKLNFIKYNKLKPFIKVFLPFYKLKWCCIMLNKFKNDKKFNNQKILKQNNQILKSQLIKTRDYFNKNFKEFNNGN